MSRFLQFDNVAFSYPGMAEPLLSGVTAHFPEGAWTGIVGANGAALRYDKSRGIVWTVGPDRKFNGEKISGKDSYGRNSGYVVNIDGSPQGTQKAERK